MMLLWCALYYYTFLCTKAPEVFRGLLRKLASRFFTLAGEHQGVQGDPGKHGQVFWRLNEILGLNYACRVFRGLAWSRHLAFRIRYDIGIVMGRPGASRSTVGLLQMVVLRYGQRSVVVFSSYS